MKITIKRLLCYVLASQVFVASLSAAETEKKALVLNLSGETVFIYENAELSGDPIAALPEKGAGYQVKEKNGILQIVSGSITGYIKDENLKKGKAAWRATEKRLEKKATITSDTAFVYDDEEVEGLVSDLLSKGDTVSVLEAKGEVLEVMTLNNIDGFLLSSDAEVSPAFDYAEPVEWESYYDSTDNLGTYQSEAEYDSMQGVTKIETDGEAIAAYARQFIGNPYVWGGVSLTEGTDCSGFIQSVYAAFHITLPRTSTEQRNSGIKVCDGWEEDKVQPGDLVCYDGHIAIYIGDGQIVHAANKKDGIKVSNADYREVLCVRRIIGSRQALQVSSEEKEILFQIVEAEAGGEDYKGKLLVANVILNRVIDSRFPNSVEGVVFQKSGTKYQFSPVMDGRYYNVTASQETKAAVRDAIKGIDPSQGSLYFLNPSIADKTNAAWFERSLNYRFTYGGHAFYR